jgi:uncharacterized protein YlxW (UPF0749 family)
MTGRQMVDEVALERIRGEVRQVREHVDHKVDGVYQLMDAMKEWMGRLTEAVERQSDLREIVASMAANRNADTKDIERLASRVDKAEEHAAQMRDRLTRVATLVGVGSTIVGIGIGIALKLLGV